MNKRSVALVISILLVALMMVACMSKNNGDLDYKKPSTEATNGTEETTEATEETTEATESGDVKIDFDEDDILVIPDKNAGNGNTGNGNTGNGSTGNGNTGSGNNNSGNTGSSESTEGTESTEPQKPNTGSGVKVDFGDFFN